MTFGWKIRATDADGKHHLVFVADSDPEAAQKAARERVANATRTEPLATLSVDELRGLGLSAGDVSTLTLFDPNAFKD